MKINYKKIGKKNKHLKWYSEIWINIAAFLYLINHPVRTTLIDERYRTVPGHRVGENRSSRIRYMNPPNIGFLWWSIVSAILNDDPEIWKTKSINCLFLLLSFAVFVIGKVLGKWEKVLSLIWQNISFSFFY